MGAAEVMLSWGSTSGRRTVSIPAAVRVSTFAGLAVRKLFRGNFRKLPGWCLSRGQGKEGKEGNEYALNEARSQETKVERERRRETETSCVDCLEGAG